MIVSKRISFDAAHYLPNYDGPCHNIHGHRFNVELAVKGPVNPVSGMIIDFAWLKEFLSIVEEAFDHKLINDTILNPTAENICLWIQDNFLSWNTDPDGLGAGPLITLAYIRVWETADSMAELKL